MYAENLDGPDKIKLNDNFDKFLDNHDNCMEELEKGNKKLPSSFGIKKIA